MHVLGYAKSILNATLSLCNLQLDSRTAERKETQRLQQLVRTGHFSEPIFPVLEQFKLCDPSAIFQEVKQHEARFAEFATNQPGGAAFSLANDYYTSPDSEVLYAIVRMYRPLRVIEVGSGNSTRLFRAAITDGGLQTKLTSIDPDPRCDIANVTSEIIARRLEEMSNFELFADLEANDVLFIDSSHELKPGNDVLRLLLSVVPRLRRGVLIHLHDIFLPYEYPREWIAEQRWLWTEQYLVQALLQGSSEFEVLWAGFYHQQSTPGFTDRFRFWQGAAARSLWLRRT